MVRVARQTTLAGVLALVVADLARPSVAVVVNPQPFNETTMALCDAENPQAACNDLTYVPYSKGNLLFAQRESDDEQCQGDYFLPVFASEPLWSTPARTVVYFALLVWVFLGVAIISDHFMASIEVITSKERIVIVENEDGESEERKVLVWDETVANLTLMALGSSAPEILLSVVETVGTLDKEPEDGLGPGTIVGSAAFNLLGISAVCIMALKNGEKRSIEGYGVFIITSTFSVFAYLWMWIVLKDNKVNLVEAFITLALFPLLVFVSYAQNKGWWGLCRTEGMSKVKPEGHVVAVDGENHKHLRRRSNGGGSGSSDRLITVEAREKEMVANLLQQLPEGLGEEEMARLAAQGMLQNGKNSALKYRIDARRKLAGGRGVIQKKINLIRKHTVQRFSQVGSAKSRSSKEHAQHLQPGIPRVGFSAYAYAVNENDGSITLPVIRSGTALELGKVTTVYFETRSGTARGSEDFVHTDGKLVFQAGETEKSIKVEIIDDNTFEPDETFYVLLSTKGTDHNADLENAEFTTAEVTIIDDDHPGTFSFPEGALVVRESEQVAKCVVRRSGGVDGAVTIVYRTKDASAKKDSEYYESTGTLIFQNGVNEASFSIGLIDDKSYDKELTFGVEFEIRGFPDNGCAYGEHRVLSVTITSDENYKHTVDRVSELMQAHLEQGNVGSGSWFEQLKDALTVQGEDGEDPSVLDCVLHIASFAWKVIFTIVPPTSYCSGYLSFFVSLVLIGLLTMLCSDIAKTFGCLLGLPPTLTAITFVAMGTSLPDTFASKTAAENDDTADNSIGNITGSNSVNVYLGLGLPWVIGTVYNKIKNGEDYRVESGNLSVTVVIFCCVAFVYFTLMFVRRRMGWGELGGPSKPKWASVAILVLLWCTYVGLSGGYSLGLIAF